MKIKFPQGTNYLVVLLEDDGLHTEFCCLRKEAMLISSQAEVFFILDADGHLVDSEELDWYNIDRTIEHLVMEGRLQVQQSLDYQAARNSGEI